MDRSKYLTTGELAKLMHITKNTLFHYDSIGLFSPEVVQDNDYRYYSIHQIEVLDAIIILKELGMPLKEIKEFMVGRNPQKLLTLIEKEEQQIEAQIKKLNDQSLWMQEMRERVNAFFSAEPGEMYIRQLPDRYYIMDQVRELDEGAVMKKTAELINYYESRSSSMRYEIGYIQYMDDIRRQVYDNYQNVILLMKQKPKEIRCHCIPAGTYLVTYFKGYWGKIGTAYEKIIDYADRNGLKLADHFVELYVIDQLMAENEEDYVTEISVALV